MKKEEIRDYKEEINRLIEEFQYKIGEGTKDSEHFLSISEIECLWGELKHNTGDIYSDMVMETLHKANEGDLVRKKKPNTGKRA